MFSTAATSANGIHSTNQGTPVGHPFGPHWRNALNPTHTLFALLALGLSYLLPSFKEDETTAKPEEIEDGTDYKRFRFNIKTLGWLTKLATPATLVGLGFNRAEGTFEAIVAKRGVDPSQVLVKLSEGYVGIQAIRRATEGVYKVIGNTASLAASAVFGHGIQMLAYAGFIPPQGLSLHTVNVLAGQKQVTLVNVTADYTADKVDASNLVVNPTIGGSKVTEMLAIGGNLINFAGRYAFTGIQTMNAATINAIMEASGRMDGFIAKIDGVEYDGFPLVTMPIGFANGWMVTSKGEKFDFTADHTGVVLAGTVEQVSEVPLSGAIRTDGTLAVINVDSEEVTLEPAARFGTLLDRNWQGLLPTGVASTGATPEQIAAPAN